MDLYGDLPPLQKGKNYVANINKQLASTINTVKANKKETEKTNKDASKSSPSKTRSNTSFMPLSLQKPRSYTRYSSQKSPSKPSPSIYKPISVPTTHDKRNKHSSADYRLDHRSSEPKYQGFLQKNIDISNTIHQKESVVVEFNPGDLINEYDPYRPNDYEAFCMERENSKRQKEMQYELEKRTRILEIARRREKERLKKEIEEGLTSDITQGRGRGNALIIPAWMKQKTQPMSSSNEDFISKENDDVALSQFEDSKDDSNNELKTSNTWQNIQNKEKENSVPSNYFQPYPNDVCDDPLSNVVLIKIIGNNNSPNIRTEILNECANKYGRIIQCVVHKQSNNESVQNNTLRIFIRFRNPDNAVKAVHELNGRCIGEIRMNAELYNETHFDNNEFDL